MTVKRARIIMRRFMDLQGWIEYAVIERALRRNPVEDMTPDEWCHLIRAAQAILSGSRAAARKVAWDDAAVRDRIVAQSEHLSELAAAARRGSPVPTTKQHFTISGYAHAVLDNSFRNIIADFEHAKRRVDIRVARRGARKFLGE